MLPLRFAPSLRVTASTLTYEILGFEKSDGRRALHCSLCRRRINRGRCKHSPCRPLRGPDRFLISRLCRLTSESNRDRQPKRSKKTSLHGSSAFESPFRHKMRVRKWPRTHQDLPATLPSGSRTDSLYIDLSQKPSVGAAEYRKVVLDYDAAGNRAGMKPPPAGKGKDIGADLAAELDHPGTNFHLRPLTSALRLQTSDFRARPLLRIRYGSFQNFSFGPWPRSLPQSAVA